MAARLRIRDSGGTLRTITRIRMRDAGNVLRTIQTIRMRDGGGTLRTVFQYLAISLSDALMYGSDSGAASSGSVATDTPASTTGTVTGGTAPYTYLWERLSGSLAITPAASTAATTGFSAVVSDGFPLNALWRLRVTDANSNVSYSQDVYIELSWSDTR